MQELYYVNSHFGMKVQSGAWELSHMVSISDSEG